MTKPEPVWDSELRTWIDDETAPLTKTEIDPNGVLPSMPGAKLDSDKNRVGLVVGGFSRAIQAVSEVGTGGAIKYTDNGWMEVPNGVARYTDALYRHLLKEAMGEQRDSDSKMLHAAHAAWNALARLDLIIREGTTNREA